MNNQYGKDQDQVSVAGFDIPNSPEASYNNVYPGTDDEGREPPNLPPHLQHTLLNYQTTSDPCAALPSPQNVTLNHLCTSRTENLQDQWWRLVFLIAFVQNLSLLCSINLFQEGETSGR